VYDITRDPTDFRRLVRTAIFGFLQDVAAHDWESAAARLAGESGPTLAEVRRIETEFKAHGDARGRFRLDPEGRAAKHTHWTENSMAGEWTVAQMLIDGEGHNDWEAQFTVALAKSRAENRAVVRFVTVKPLGR